MVAKTKRRVLEKQNAPYLLGQGPVYQYGVFRVPKNGILVNK